MKFRSSNMLPLIPLFSMVLVLIPVGEIGMGGANFFPHIALISLLSIVFHYKTILGSINKNVYPPKYSLFLLILIFLYFISLVHLIRYENYLKSFVYLIAYSGAILTFFIIVAIGMKRELLFTEKFFKYNLLFCLMLSLIYFLTGDMKLFGNSALVFNRNDYAMLMTQAVIFLFGIFFSRKGLKVSYYFLILIFLIGILLSANRGALLGLLLSITILLSVTSTIKLRTKLLVAGLLSVGIFLMWVNEHRLIQSIISRKEYQDIARVAIMKVVKDVLLENYLFGVGVGNYWSAYMETVTSSDLMYWLPQNIYNSVYNVARPPHNLYMRIGVELGVLGLLTIFLANISIIFYFYKKIKSKNSYAISGFLYAITYSFHSIFYEGYIYPFHFIFLGFLYVGYRVSIREELGKNQKLIKI